MVSALARPAFQQAPDESPGAAVTRDGLVEGVGDPGRRIRFGGLGELLGDQRRQRRDVPLVQAVRCSARARHRHRPPGRADLDALGAPAHQSCSSSWLAGVLSVYQRWPGGGSTASTSSSVPD